MNILRKEKKFICFEKAGEPAAQNLYSQTLR